jgi:hypothetical protein
MWNLSYRIVACGGVAFLEGRVTECLPHVHDGQANLPAFFRAQPGEEPVQAGLGTVLSPEPNGTATLQVAHHDAVPVPLGDSNLVDADHPRGRVAGSSQLLAHVLLVQLLDGMPIEEEFLGYLFDGSLPAATAHEEGEPLGVEGIVGQPVQAFVLHAPAPRALDAAKLEDEVDAFVATGEVADAARPLVVMTAVHLPTDAAQSFFRRRRRVRSTAAGSPKTPRTRGRGTKPGKR